MDNVAILSQIHQFKMILLKFQLCFAQYKPDRGPVTMTLGNLSSRQPDSN